MQIETFPNRISSKRDLKFFLEADRIALQKKSATPRPVFDEVWKWQIQLRKVEYATNCGRGPIAKIARLIRYFLFQRMSVKLGFEVPPNVFGPGLNIAHYGGGLIVNQAARIGANCRVHTGIVIGTAAGRSSDCPKLGNGIFIGPGAKLFGPVEIGSDTAIGANAVVNKSFPEGGITIAGAPAKKVSDRGSQTLLVKGATADLYASISD